MPADVGAGEHGNDGNAKKKDKRSEFNESLWGDNTRAWAVKAMSMDRQLWERVLLDSLARIGAGGGDDEDETVENDEGGIVNPRSLILIDWLVHIPPYLYISSSFFSPFRPDYILCPKFPGVV